MPPKKSAVPLPQIFQNIHFCITGELSEPRKDVIDLIEQLGGEVFGSAAQHVNVVIASQAEFFGKSVKCQSARRNRPPIVREEWLRHSITAQKVLPFNNYLWAVHYSCLLAAF